MSGGAGRGGLGGGRFVRQFGLSQATIQLIFQESYVGMAAFENPTIRGMTPEMARYAFTEIHRMESDFEARANSDFDRVFGRAASEARVVGAALRRRTCTHLSRKAVRWALTCTHFQGFAYTSQPREGCREAGHCVAHT